MFPKLSIIVPVYNAEKYLSECLRSLMQQSIEDIEIILVDDLSTDRSRDIIKEFTEKDDRIKAIYNTTNRGVSKTRNCGLENAKGEFIGFVDSDDYVDHKMYEKMYSIAIRSSAEIVTCGYQSVDDNKKITKTVAPPLQSNKIITHQDMKSVIHKAHINKFLWFTWRNIYKRELLLDNNIVYDEEIDYGEDNIFNLNAFYNAKNIVAIDEPLYYYRINPTGLSKSSVKPYLNKSVQKEYERKYQFYNEYNLWEECKEDLSNYVSTHLLPRMLINAKRSGENVRSILEKEMVKTSLENTSFKVDSSLNTKLMVILAKLKQEKLLNFLVGLKA